jgi:hypothetical protein
MIVAGGEVEPIDSKAHREKKSQVHVDPTSTPDQHGALISHFCNQKASFFNGNVLCTRAIDENALLNFNGKHKY